MAKTERAMAGTGTGLVIERYFTKEGIHPYDEVEWDIRDAIIPNFKDGGNAFEQLGVEFPKSWSQNATNIVAQKYFRGPLGTPQRERSVRQLVDRVADTITQWGWKDGYFADEQSRDVFNHELKHILVTQKAAFNSPVWFNVGSEKDPQCSACQPWGALVSTPEGFVPIGELVEQNAIGRRVLDSEGETRVVAVKHNGRKRVFRVLLRNGSFIEATADHLVRAVPERRAPAEWKRVDQLVPGMRLHLHPHRATGEAGADELAVSEAALAGWLQADGFVGQYEKGTNRSLTIEFQVANHEEQAWIKQHLDVVFPTVHRKERPVEGLPEFARVRLYGEVLRDFVERYGLLNRRHEIRVPDVLWTAPRAAVAAYLRSVFQADGFVSTNGTSTRIGFAVISEKWTEDLQVLLMRLGVYSRRYRKPEKREDRSDLWGIDISYESERRTFAEQVGFVALDKDERLRDSLHGEGKSCSDLREEEIVSIQDLGVEEVYDIQTESGHYLSNNVSVHNCFILAVEDTMSSILNWYVEEGTIFKGGSGSGINLSTIRSSRERLSAGGEASGPVSFMRGADASAGTIKSGGKTRRAAKMVILNVDHPDVEDFIWCKAREEQKARVLRDAGFDMDLDGRDAYSIQYQNANNSVRVTDEFMMAVIEDRDWALKGVISQEVIETKRARDLMRQVAQAAWECADPGVQYDTTINAWHTSSNTGRINASNPCFPGDQRVHTDKGLIRFDDLMGRVLDGETFEVYTNDATNPDREGNTIHLSKPTHFMVTGVNEIVRLRFDDGREIRCTPGHRIWTENRGWVEAKDLTEADLIPVLDQPTPATMADHRLPVSADAEAFKSKGDWARALALPEKWDEDLAHYLGWLVGDGCISGNVVTTVYGSDEDQREIMPKHLELLTRLNGGRAPKPSIQENGTVQLRLSRRPLARFFEALGVKPGKAATKEVPWSIFEAPQDIVRAFLRGLFDADGCAVNLRNGTRYVGLGSKSNELLRGVQMLLSTEAVASRIYDVTGKGTRSFFHTRKDGTTVEYKSKGRSFDLRIFSSSKARFYERVGFSLERKQRRLGDMVRDHATYLKHRATKVVERRSDGFELTYNLTEPMNHTYCVGATTVRNCSEYMHLDNSACNLASLNLMKFVDEDMSFDIRAFKHAIDIVFLAQEIIVGNSSYPTARIGQNAKNFRELGLGYANLGALLMARGLPYDSEAGRAWAGAITALMTGWAYRDSAVYSGHVGPHAGFAVNREPMLNVMRKHRAAVDQIDPDLVPEGLLQAAKGAWDDAVALGEQHGYRNAQASVLAPTGTIGLMMDCDTTGIEPDLALVKTKKLVGGGTMRIVNQTVPRALKRLGYDDDQVNEIVGYIADNNTVEGAPHIREEDIAVFDCAMGDRPIHYLGHVKMMGAVQPFISGAISKCVTGETLLTTEDGLIRISALHMGEPEDSFRDENFAVASLDGTQKATAFYYGGSRPVRELVLRSGHRITGTPNHPLLVAADGGLVWRRLDEIEPGDHVAQRYGADMWAVIPPRLDAFIASAPYGRQRSVRIPQEMTEKLAFLLGAYVSEGHVTRSNWTVSITNADENVLREIAEAYRDVFGVEPRIGRYGEACPQVIVSSKTIVEFLDWLGCGERASTKRIPDAILRSPREMVLSFLRGLALDAYVAWMGNSPKWAICLDAPALLDDLQAVLTNLGVVHSRISKRNAQNGKSYDEVYASGEHAQALIRLVPFAEEGKRRRAEPMLHVTPSQSTSDVVPGIDPKDLYELIPRGTAGNRSRTPFTFLLDPRTTHVSRRTLERVAAVPGVELPHWLTTVLGDGLRFSPVERVADAGEREVYDISVPATKAFIGNGIVNHNTINMPEDASVEEVEELFIEGWRLGLKAVAIYRDNCKVAQPLSADKKKSDKVPDPAVLATGQPQRRRLPKSRPSRTTSFRVGDAEGYILAGEYPDDGIGEIFLKVSKQGSTLSGVMDALAISVSLGLQYGVPLEAYGSKFMNMRFEPSGMTDDPDVRFATSLVDYVFRRLAIDYLDEDARARLGIMTTDERREAVSEAPSPQPIAIEPPAARSAAEDAQAIRLVDAPLCYNCGNTMRPAGSCYVCESCGATSGCS